MTSSNYSTFGVANPLTQGDIDPVEQCIPGKNWFTKTGIPGSRMEESACVKFMAQRCSVNWDQYCQAYLTESNTDSGGFLHVNKEFLAESAKKKYCRLASGASGVHCATKCEAFLPEQQSSVNICENVGTQNWLDTKNEYDLGGNFPQSARLNPISPLYLGHCPETCDASNLKDPNALGPNDQVLNNCIKYGTCEQILMDLAYNLVKIGKEGSVTNPAFKTIIDLAKLDRPLNPNVAAKIATSYGIPPATALDVLQQAKYGPVQYKMAATPNMGSPPTPGPSPTLPSQPTTPIRSKAVVSPVSSKREGFYPPQKLSSTSKVFLGIGIIIVLAIIVWLIFLKLK